MKRILFLLLFLLTVPNFGQNRKESAQSFCDTFSSDAFSAFNTGFATFEKPLNFDTQDWLALGVLSAGTGALFTLDKSVRSIFLSNQNAFFDNFFSLDKYYGTGYTALITAGIYGAGLFTGNDKLRKRGLYSSEAFIIAGIAVSALKVIIGRRRPYKGESNLVFHPFPFFDNDYKSLPSGHTTVAFAVSTVMAKMSESIYLKIFWYGLASSTALARVYHNQHWASDIFLGAGLGYFVGKFVFDYNTNEVKKSLSVKVIPTLSFNRIGLSILF